MVESCYILLLAGTTAVIAVLCESCTKLVIANVGDSRAIICRRDSDNKIKVVLSSADHNLDRLDEVERILAANGMIVERNGGIKRVIPNPKEFSEDDIIKQKLALNMSRSLGHTILSNYGVCSQPEFFSTIIQNDDILILASDGLWELMENNEVADFVCNYNDLQQACREISREVANRCKLIHRKSDNLTIIVVQFTITPLQPNITST